MYKRMLFTLLITLTLSAPVAAEPGSGSPKGTAGFGAGAVVGGFIGGPIGAVTGAIGGAWLGNRESDRDRERQQLERSLADRSARLQTLQNQIAELEQAQALQTVQLNESPQLAGPVREALHMAVYFRTGSARMEPAVSGRLEELAGLLQDYPDIRVHLSGHTDRRGDADYNRELSRRRAEAVRTALTQAGLPAERIHVAAYGQSQAQAVAGDIEAYIFDRRVSIELNPMDPV